MFLGDPMRRIYRLRCRWGRMNCWNGTGGSAKMFNQGTNRQTSRATAVTSVTVALQRFPRPPSSQSTQSEMPSKKSATCSSQVQSPYPTRHIRVPTVVELAAVPSAFILVFCFCFLPVGQVDPRTRKFHDTHVGPQDSAEARKLAWSGAEHSAPASAWSVTLSHVAYTYKAHPYRCVYI